MNYQKQELKEGITLHNINTDKFKTNLTAIFLTIPLTRENVTLNAVLSSVLRRGSTTMPTQDEISKQMEEMYGADFDCGINKTGDNHVLKFYLESVNDDFLPEKTENLIGKSIDKITEIVFAPYLKKGKFLDEYVEQEKENVKQIILAKADNKASYATYRCMEEMYKGEPASLYRYGYEEDLDKINAETLYNYYEKLKNECKIDIFISGKIDFENCKKIIEQNEYIKNLNPRKAKYIINDITAKTENKEKLITENMEVSQGKIVIGCDILFDEEDTKNKDIRYSAMLYNSLFGGSATSKLFRNVREKASLAYTANSNYFRYKGNIFINAGIEIENYDKAMEIIRKQIDDMKNGDFTEEEIENEKKRIISEIDSIDDEQDTEVIYFFGQELTKSEVTIDEYKEKIKKVTKQEILNIASKIKINTIYFLKN